GANRAHTAQSAAAAQPRPPQHQPPAHFPQHVRYSE
ncbi:hypothetical protein A2U01_0119406, partial [Trifolium medium]|nr:hypothetical protein [Trifolium medium]